MIDNQDDQRPQLARRGLLTSVGVAAIATMGTTLAGSAQAAAAIDDAAILNFALNLEYLEAEFYLRAATGKGLADMDTGGTGARGPVLGGSMVPFKTKALREYATEIAEDELNHVRFIRSALGGAAVARPKIDLDTAFTTAARAAGLINGSQRFDAFANETNFLLAAFIFEDVGVTAYKGAARLIASKDVLEAAAGILAVEAYHAGQIRTLLYGQGLFAAARAISDARDSLDGAGKKDQGIRWKDSANIIPADANGLAFSRTTGEVLKIVYLGGAGSKFGFFPNRLNGGIR
ncbi:MAG: ferritin-like domain-containing protein [Geminicoccaceae bacterium]